MLINLSDTQRSQASHSDAEVAAPKNVFVKLPTQAGSTTVCLSLNGSESTTTQVLEKLGKVADPAAKRLVLSVEGRPLTDPVAQLEHFCSVMASPVLLGGAGGGGSQTGQGRISKTTVKSATNKGAQQENQVRHELVCEEITGEADAERIYVTPTDTVNSIKEKWEEKHGEGFTYRAKGKIIEFVDEIEEDGSELVETLKLGPSDVIQVKRSEVKKADLSVQDQFLLKLPYLRNVITRGQIKKFLEPAQEKLMEKYMSADFDSDDDLKRILITMTDGQIDKMLNQIVSFEKMEILKYLLIKAEQWTNISAIVIEKASEDTKDFQIRRLMHKLQNRYDPNNENDAIILELLRKNKNLVLNDILSNMTDAQITELFMQWLNEEQRGKLIEFVKPEDVLHFWEILEKARRMDVWRLMSPVMRAKFMITQTYLSEAQKLRLWDNIGKENRVKFWGELNDDAVHAQCLSEKDIQRLQSEAKEREVESQIENDENIGKSKKKKRVGVLASQVTIQKSYKTAFLYKRLFEELTVFQQVRLWSSLSDSEDRKTLMQIITEDVEKAFEFWNLLRYDRRCVFIELLEMHKMAELFLKMDLEARTELITMVNMETKKFLAEKLSKEDKQQLFFYSHFSMREKTEGNSEQFISNLLDEHYQRSELVVPFDKISDGYVQCIYNPHVRNGFIMVQIVEPQYVVDNTVFHVSADVTEQELHSDEAQHARASEQNKFNMFRLNQNRYGVLQEEEPNEARNAKRLGIFSFFEYSQEQGFQCKHSFFAPNPVCFQSNGSSASEIVLYQGHNGDIFFFNEREVKTIGVNKQDDLYLQILQPQYYADLGELSRRVEENCYSSRINKTNKLYDFILKGKFVMKEYSNVYMLNSVPSIISHGDDKYVVFAHCSRDQSDPGICLFFHNVFNNSLDPYIPGGEALIDYYVDPHDVKKARVVYLANKEVMSMIGWSKENQVKQDHAKVYLKSQVAERKTAVVGYLEVSLKDATYQQNLCHAHYPANTEDEPILKTKLSDQETEDNAKMGSWLPEYKSEMQFLPIELKDESNKFHERYMRNTPVFIMPHQRNREGGYAEQFTILFQNVQSYTFSLSLSQKMRLKKEKERRAQERQEQVEAEQRALEAKQKAAAAAAAKRERQRQEAEERKAQEAAGALDKNGKPRESVTQAVANEEDSLSETAPQQTQDQTEQTRPATPKVETDFGKIPEDMVFKCKYIVPGASEFVQDRREELSSNKVRTLIQVTNNNEDAIRRARDNPKDVNGFEILLYNIVDEKQPSAIEKIPAEQKVKAYISKQAILSYQKNTYGGRSGEYKIFATACPVLFTQHGVSGCFLFHAMERQVQKQLMHWFESPTNYYAEKRISHPVAQTCKVDYPLLVYKGFVPDNRELVMVNLADKQQPQKIIHLFDKQFVCFVGHNFASRDSKIGFLAHDGEYMRLCWLISHHPFEKKESEDLDDYQIEEEFIQFKIPILDQLENIVRAEFINMPGSDSLTDTGLGALVIQTKTEIYMASCLTGEYQSVTTGRMAELEMQRGYNSFFYYAERAGNGSDMVLKELSLNVVSQKWEIEQVEIWKINEGRIIALEMDPENIEKTDSCYTYGNQLIEKRREVLNRLYIIDDKENLHHLRQKQESETGSTRYAIIHEQDMNPLKAVLSELYRCKQLQFNRVSITQRCLSINDKNFNLHNCNSWPLIMVKKGCKAHTDQQEDLVAIESEPESDETESDDQNNQIAARSSNFKVHSVKGMEWTSRQLIDVSYQDFNPETEHFNEHHVFITKRLPGSRRQDLVGARGLRDMESINLIAEKLCLMKFRASDRSGISDYWTVIDWDGQIRPLPQGAEKVLIWSNFSSGASRIKPNGCTIVLRGGQKNIVSLEADAAYEEHEVTKIEFSRSGEVVEIKSFNKSTYDQQLRNLIIKNLRKDPNLTTDEGKVMSKNLSKKVARSLKYQDQVLCTKDGHLYRFASIVYKNFTDDVAINLAPDPRQERSDPEDKINMGIFVIKGNKQVGEEESESKLQPRNNDMKIVLFLCRKERDRYMLNKAGFCICGNYLCWSYPEEKIVHILNMKEMNAVDVVEKPSEVIKALNSFVSGFRKLQRQASSMFGSGLKKLVESPSKSSSKVKQGKILPMMEMEDELDFPSERDNEASQPDEKIKANISDQIKQINALLESTANLEEEKEDEELSALQLAQRKAREYVKIAALHANSQNFITKELSYLVSIHWRRYTTKVLNLSVMCETDSDCLNMFLSEVPKSTQFSIDRRSGGLSEEGFGKINIHDNLLQVSIANRTVLFDIVHEKPQELFFFNATQQFIHADKFVESGIMVVQCKENPSKEKDGFLIDMVVCNRNKDLQIIRQDRRFFSRKIKFDNLVRSPVCLAVFKKYAEVDVQELSRISNKVINDLRIDNIDMSTVLSIFNDHTVFSIFNESEKFHRQILNQVEEGEFPEEEQEDETLVENNILRRLYRILTLPTPDLVMVQPKKRGNRRARRDTLLPVAADKDVALEIEGAEAQTQAESPRLDEIEDHNVLSRSSSRRFIELKTKKEKKKKKQAQAEQEIVTEENKKAGLRSVLLKSMYLLSGTIKDTLMSITNVCEECNITNFCENQNDFRKLITQLTNQSLELIQDSFVQTPFTKKIVFMPWSADQSSITFRKVNTILTEDECEQQIEEKLKRDGVKKNDQTKAQVEVRLLDLSWLLADKKSFVDFVNTLSARSSVQIYNTELVSTLLDEFWEENYRKILYKVLIPWAFYAFFTLLFFAMVLKENSDDYVRVSLGGVSLILLFYQISVEIRQVRNETDKKKYFKSVMNWIEIFQITSTLWLLAVNLMFLEFPSYYLQRVGAAFSTLCIWIKVVDWCRLFKPTSFFIRLITETIWDIRYFFIIFCVALMMFGTPMYMLQLNRTEEEDSVIVDNTFGFWFLNALYQQYMLSLGEFSIDNFDDGSTQQYMIWFFFLVSTFITQITFLNMLIAIMSDTFSRVIESKGQFGLMTKLEIMSDYTAVIQDKNVQDTRSYLFVVTQKAQGDDDGNSMWEGNLTLIKKTLDKGLNNINKHLDKKITIVQAQNTEAKNRDMLIEKDSRNQYMRIMERFLVYEGQFESIEQKTAEINNEMQSNAYIRRIQHTQSREYNASLQKSQAKMIEATTKETEELQKSIDQTTKRLLTEITAVTENKPSDKKNEAGESKASESASQKIDTEPPQQETVPDDDGEKGANKVNEDKSLRVSVSNFSRSRGKQYTSISQLTKAQDHSIEEIQSLKERQQNQQKLVKDNLTAFEDIRDDSRELLEELISLKRSDKEFQSSFSGMIRDVNQQQTQPAPTQERSSSNQSDVQQAMLQMMKRLWSNQQQTLTEMARHHQEDLQELTALKEQVLKQVGEARGATQDNP